MMNVQNESKKQQEPFNRLVWLSLLAGAFPLFGVGTIAAFLLMRHLNNEVERVDAENPNEVREHLLRLPQSGEAELLLRKLERMRTDVLHAMNAIEGLPKGREPFAVRLKRMNKQGKLPSKIFRQVQVLSSYRNRAVYESYHLRSDELQAVDRAFDEVGEWTRKVGYVY